MRIRVGVYDLTLEIKGVGSSRKARKGKITQSAQRETCRVFQSSRRSLRVSHSALYARDVFFHAKPAKGKSRKVRKEKPTVICKTLGDLCVHLTSREMKFSRKARKGKITQSAQRETYRVFQSSWRSLRASHSAISARDVFFHAKCAEGNLIKKPGTTLRRVFIIIGLNYFNIKRCVA